MNESLKTGEYGRVKQSSAERVSCHEFVLFINNLVFEIAAESND